MTLLLVVALALVVGVEPARAASCPPEGSTRADLLALKASGFDTPDTDRLAVSLVACLDDPDPAVRDGVVFEGLSTWLRGGRLRPATVIWLADAFVAALRADDDPRGFRRPFAALLLSEVARADRLEPVLAAPTRAAMVDLAAGYLAGVVDYRGFDEAEGWRHGVAHGADLVLQLALNPHVDAPSVRRLMDAVAAKVAPAGPVFYIYGEPERLARAVFFAHRRDVLDADTWRSWFEALAAPHPLASWSAAYQTQAGLARRHNTVAFLHAVGFAGRTAGDAGGQALARLADEALGKLMQ